MKTILITGGCGFIGSNFVHYVLAKYPDYSVVNLDKLTYAGNVNSISSLVDGRKITFHHTDIGDRVAVHEIFESANPIAVFNLAAESHVDRSIDKPAEFIQTNVLGTINLLECSQNYFESYSDADFKFIHISTDEVYGALGYKDVFDEESSYNPSSPYSASKASSDHFVNSWYKTYGLPSIVTNCSNNYGPFQFPEKLIPLMIINAISNKPLPVYGNGKNIRDWIHVTDHCDAIIKIIELGKIGEKYNIGGDCEIENIEIVNIICKYLDKIKPRSCGNSYNKLIEYVDDRPGHDFRYAVDFSKIKNTLGWKPEIKFSSGIKNTIEWYINNSDWWGKIINDKYNLERLGKKK